MAPHRLNEFRGKIQFVTAARHPSLIRQAAEKTGCIGPSGRASSTRYIQVAICRALSRDLGLDYDELLAELPPLTGRAAVAQRRAEHLAQHNEVEQ